MKASTGLNTAQQGTEFLRYQLNKYCAPHGTRCPSKKEKVLEHRKEAEQAFLLQILSEINLDKRNSCCHQRQMNQYDFLWVKSLHVRPIEGDSTAGEVTGTAKVFDMPKTFHPG